MEGRRLGALCALGLLTITSVAGCSMFHSNIKGGFACSAPDGSCAPTTIIDDSALRSIKQGEKADSSTGSDMTLPAPAGATASGQPANVILSAERLGKDGHGADPIGGHALRVVYPAHRDATGRLVPRTIAYALVNLPESAERQTGPLLSVDGKVTTGVSRGLLGAAEHAPDALAALPASALPPAAAPATAMTATPAQPAPQTGAAPSPIDRIKAEAAQILTTAPAKSAGTFSPSGN